MMKPLLKLFILSLIVAGLLASIITIARAVPAAPVAHIERQPDGTVFYAKTMGDEFVNWKADDEGFAIVRHKATGQWRYAELAPDGTFTATAYAPGFDRPADVGISPNLAPARPVDAYGAPVSGSISRGDAYGAPESGFGALLSPSRAPAMAPPAMPLNQPVIVIMVDYGNEVGEAGAKTHMTDKVFSTSFGSVKHLFDATSNGQVSVAEVTESHGTANDGVVGYLRLGATHPNFGGTIGASAQTLAKAAIAGADPYIDFSVYDANGDGEVSPAELCILIVVAGGGRIHGRCGQHHLAPPLGVFPHGSA